MKPLIAVHACHRYDANRQAIRDTWFDQWKHLVDIRFFIGNPAGDESDVVYLDCPDTFVALGLKTWGLAQWARTNSYTNVFKCDDDTYVHVPRLLASGFEQHEYTGRMCHGHAFRYAQGGAGYWLAGRALDVVADSGSDYWMQKPALHNNFEDLGTGILLQHAKIGLFDDPRYFNGTTLKWGYPVEGGNDTITSHKCLDSHMRLVHSRLFPSIES
jgi:hypothetical protein